MSVAGAKTRTLGSDLVLEMEALTEASSVVPALTPCSGGASRADHSPWPFDF